MLVLHERKTRITLMSRLAGKSAGETIAAMTAAFRWLDPHPPTALKRPDEPLRWRYKR